ncbi:hypothetical protein LNV09_04970 [Paucibacter sp. B2R-40]|uniref:hypothetical protein n=1 Tax=Paucibacter sp. B2R-40 TaxID=2893554 RepID=UPI0021E3D450|nr:hypothetical protein [Paucibacter sp. B2R-40]MCV2353509.1 hypothetical protein [Paucibacter sp. B2R-40]
MKNKPDTLAKLRRHALQLGFLTQVLILTACGGGGSSDSPAPDPAPPPVLPVPPLSAECQPGSVARLAQEAAPLAGRNTEIALLACSGKELKALSWRQTGGAPLNLLSARSQAITLDPLLGQAYRFDLSYQDGQGSSFVQSVLVEAKAAQADDAAALRGEPSVLAGGKTSVRVTSAKLGEADWALATVQWRQLDGPTVYLGETNGQRVVFTAPQTTIDATLRLQADITLASGAKLSGQFNLLVQAPPPNAPADLLFSANDPASRVYPYLAQGPYASALDECVYNPRLTSSNLCTLGKLPLLGQATAGQVPTIEQVMQRVLVSNDWMGEVFERFLREEDKFGDYRRMLASVTAIVIGGRVRPAFYWNATGAIYLDASNLWLTPEQRDTVSESPDPRSNNGALLGFASPWRYVKDNQHAYNSLAREPRLSRPLSEVDYALGSLLYHELTHAADFMPPRTHATLPTDKRVYQAGPARGLSQSLYEQYPFFSRELQSLAKVLSFGAAPTPQQIAYTPSDIVYFFSADRVNDDYAYSVPDGQSFSREDAAMLVEETMMQLRYGVLRDYAVTNKLVEGALSADLIITWGQRGRIGEAAIKPRAKLVLAEALPWVDTALVDTLAPPLMLRAGQSWGANLDQAALAAGKLRPLSAQQRLNEREQTTRELRSR